MKHGLRSTLAATAAAALYAGAIGLASAQTVGSGNPPIPRMPMPPSASDPAPKENPRAKPRRRSGADAGEAATTRSRGAGGGATTSSAADRPSKYVPDEFDDRSGGGAKPFLSESGRPGMGMRF